MRNEYGRRRAIFFCLTGLLSRRTIYCTSTICTDTINNTDTNPDINSGSSTRYVHTIDGASTQYAAFFFPRVVPFDC